MANEQLEPTLASTGNASNLQRKRSSNVNCEFWFLRNQESIICEVSSNSVFLKFGAFHWINQSSSNWIPIESTTAVELELILLQHFTDKKESDSYRVECSSFERWNGRFPSRPASEILQLESSRFREMLWLPGTYLLSTVPGGPASPAAISNGYGWTINRAADSKLFVFIARCLIAVTMEP